MFLRNAAGLPVAFLALFSSTLTRAAGTLHEVEIRDFKYVPDTLSVRIGDQVKWTNVDLAPHTATADDGSWDTGELKLNQSMTLLVTEEMNEEYFCAFHPHMKAKIAITR